MLTILKHFLLTGIDGRKAIRRIAQPQPEGLRSSGLGAAPQSPQKNHSFCGSGMDGFSHLYYRCIACQYYTKLGIIVASNAYGAPYAKPLVSTEVEVRGFCLLRLCPNPRRTQFCVLETLEKSSSYAILQIAKWASTPVLFRFSRHGERIVPRIRSTLPLKTILRDPPLKKWRNCPRSRKSGLKNIHLKNRRNNEVPPNQSHRLGGTFRYSFCFGQILGSTSRKCQPIFSGSISFASQMKRMVSGNRMWPFAFSSLYFIHSSYSLFVICFMLPPPYNKNSRDTPTSTTYPSNANLPLKRQNRRRNN